ncbi:MAG: hypothetical protein ACD_58C00273G0010 [uncultured bacterium]|nr:MAG: hypothetical protein ACD_58C00273G0010 [uncultured bacterium]
MVTYSDLWLHVIYRDRLNNELRETSHNSSLFITFRFYLVKLSYLQNNLVYYNGRR